MHYVKHRKLEADNPREGTPIFNNLQQIDTGGDDFLQHRSAAKFPLKITISDSQKVLKGSKTKRST